MSVIKLKFPHTHAGRKYPAGAILKSMRPDQAEWLIGIGIAEAVTDTEAEAPAAPAKTRTKKEQ